MIFDISRAPDHMWQFRGQTVDKFGYDQSGFNIYRFNDQGYRSDVDFDFSKPCLVTIGPSISFGIGLPIEKTFSFLLAQKLKLDNYNFGIGCLKHTNNDYLDLLIDIGKKPNIQGIIINWNNLSRVQDMQEVYDDYDRSNCISRLESLLETADQLISVPKFYILFDPDQLDLPTYLKNKLLIYNKGVMDFSECCGGRISFGPKTNQFIYKVILSQRCQFYQGS
jgi:hypothetical protein